MGKLNSLLIHRELTAQVTAKASFLLTARLKYPHGDLEEVNVLEWFFRSTYTGQIYPPCFTARQNHF